MKKVISLVLSVMMMLTMFAGCKASGTAETAAPTAAPTSSTAAETSADTTPAVQEFNVAIVQQLDHASLDEIRTAIVAQLQALAQEKGIKVNIQEFNGQNDATVLNQIGAQVVGDGVDLIIPIATLAAQCMVTAADGTDIPIVYAAISDPEAAGLTGLSNVTGTSDALPVAGQLELIRALQPDADTIGIVYTTSEANSVYSVGVYEDLAADYGFTIDAVGVTSQAEVTQAVDTLLSHGVDCLSNLTDNNVVGVLGAILEKTDEAGIPVYGSEVEQVKLGCVAGAGLDYVQLGIQTGLMAAKVLTGEATCQDLPYETIENYGLYVNSDTAAKLGITIPDDIAQQAEECAE